MTESCDYDTAGARSTSTALDDVMITIDVEWAHPAVLADTVALLDERGVRATFFCTHEGIEVPGHERALHPNFRRTGNSVARERNSPMLDDRAFYHSILSANREFCPEAIGVRSHSLLTDSDLFPIYRDAGLEYDSSYFHPLTPGISPFVRARGILELPIFYMDHWDVSENATKLRASDLKLDRAGLKVLVFHPNLVFTNARTAEEIENNRAHYHEPELLLENRSEGVGVRTLFIELLDNVARRESSNRVMSDINYDWRR